MPLIADLLRAEDNRLPGPAPSYGKAQLLLAVLAIGDAGTIGRQTLARATGVGEGAIRTIIKRLKQGDHIITTASGCSLTAKGKRLYANAKALLPNMLAIPHTELAVGREQVAVLVRGMALNVVDGIRQRDEAVKAGAEGATTFVIVRSKFKIPGASQDCESDYPGRIWSLLWEKLRPANGDAIIICGARDQVPSRVGAVSAALTLIG